MKQELSSKTVLLSEKELEELKISSIEKLKELEVEFKAGKIKEFHYLIFKRGLQEAIRGELVKVKYS